MVDISNDLMGSQQVNRILRNLHTGMIVWCLYNVKPKETIEETLQVGIVSVDGKAYYSRFIMTIVRIKSVSKFLTVAGLMGNWYIPILLITREHTKHNRLNFSKNQNPTIKNPHTIFYPFTCQIKN